MAVSDADRRARAGSEERRREEREPQGILLCVDLSYQTYRAAAAHPMLTSRRVFTGGLYGFFTTVAKIIRDTRATRVVFCQDAKPYVRSKTYPEYKQLRKKDRDEELYMMFTQSMSLVLEALASGRLPIWSARGFESDDLIAHAAVKYRGRFHSVYAASNDSDLYQLLDSPRVRVYRKSLADIMDGRRLQVETGLTPQEYMLASALMGTHNDIAGIPRVGEKTAIRAVKEPALLRSYRAAHGALIERNLGLIKLPHADLPWETALPARERPNVRELWRTLSHYDIDVTGSMAQAFESL